MPSTVLDEVAELLNEFSSDRSISYREVEWVQDFQAPVWHCVLGKTSFSLDFRICLSDGLLLTNKKHADLRDALGCFICSQTHIDLAERGMFSTRTASMRVKAAVRICDWFLVNEQALELASAGLVGITASEIRRLISDLSKHAYAADSIYRWRERLSHHLKSHFDDVDAAATESIIRSFPGIDVIGDRSDFALGLSDDEIIRARVLMIHWQWHRQAEITSPFKWRLRGEEASKELYRNTLRGVEIKKPIPPELCFGSSSRRARELGRVDARPSGTRVHERSHDYYKRILKAFELLPRANARISPALASISKEFPYFRQLDRRPSGRVGTLPIEEGFRALRNSIEFFFEHGDAIADSYLRAARFARDAGVDDLADLNIEQFVDQSLKDFGVKVWSIHSAIRSGVLPKSTSQHEYLRANLGLYELLRVLIGCVQVCVGLVMARRRSEISEAKSDNALDETGRYFNFGNAKSGPFGVREILGRPIPAVAASMLKLLRRIQAELLEAGLISGFSEIFSHTGRSGTSPLLTRFEDCFDTFCDYFQTAIDSEGNRLYFRQHQLRRFFAMVFFWSRSFGGLDTLRWFLGQTDPEHVYHYITETLTEPELNGVKAQYLAARLREEPSPSPLLDFLRQRYDISEVVLMDLAELEAYLEQILEEGSVTVEPDYFRDGGGKSYRILVRMTHTGVTM